MAGGENKRSKYRLPRLRKVAEILHERGVEPVSAICDVLPELDPSMRARTLLALTEFVHPKLGRVEVAGDPDSPLQHEHTHKLSDAAQRVIDELAGAGKAPRASETVPR